jgi:hypothetical protein
LLSATSRAAGSILSQFQRETEGVVKMMDCEQEAAGGGAGAFNQELAS